MIEKEIFHIKAIFLNTHQINTFGPSQFTYFVRGIASTRICMQPLLLYLISPLLQVNGRQPLYIISTLLQINGRQLCCRFQIFSVKVKHLEEMCLLQSKAVLTRLVMNILFIYLFYFWCFILSILKTKAIYFDCLQTLILCSYGCYNWFCLKI